MLTKSPLNPIITAPSNLNWANKKVYNSAAVLVDGKYHLFFRAIGDDYISRIGHAVSDDGTHFDILPEPVFEPLEEWESKGCEDPRITKIDNFYVMAYTAFDGRTARIALTTTNDFITWSKRTIAFADWREGHWVDPSQKAWNKAAAVFPEKIDGKYFMYFGDDSVWCAYSDDLTNWTPITTPILESRSGHFDSGYVEMGPPPILTEKGWLIIYHGINSWNKDRIYRIGAALASLEDPKKIIWRCTNPILEPTELFERIGNIDIIEGGMQMLKDQLQELSQKGELPQAVFCCGAIAQDDEVKFYYSGSDTVLCLASGRLDDILKS